jgi:DHA2 family multidrug resistance protein
MHGLLLGLFVPATLIIIFRNLPVKWWITGVAVYAFRSAFTANAGVSLLDFYVQHLGWQFCYWQDVLLAPIMAFLAFFGTPHEQIDREKVRTADWGGMLLLGFGLAFIFVGVDQGNRLDWLQNGTVVSFLVGGTTLIVAFLINEAVVTNPWASIDVIGARNLLLLLTLALLYLITGLSNTSLIPNYLISVSGLRPEQIGAVLAVWCCIPLLIMTPLVAWGLHLVDGRWLLLIGLCCFAGAAILGTGLTAEWSGDTFRMICVLQGAGHILTFLPIIVLVLANGNPQRAASLAAYIQVIRLLGNEMAQAMMTTFLRKREQLHSFLIGLDVQKGDALTSSALSATTKKLAPFSNALSQSRATTLLTQQVSKQANVLAYIDGFWLTFIAAVVGLLVLALVARAPKGPLSAS